MAQPTIVLPVWHAHCLSLRFEVGARFELVSWCSNKSEARVCAQFATIPGAAPIRYPNWFLFVATTTEMSSPLPAFDVSLSQPINWLATCTGPS